MKTTDFKLSLFILLILLTSCAEDNTNIMENVSLSFYPRAVTELFLYPAGARVDATHEYKKVDTWDGLRGDAIPVNAYYMCFKTSDIAFRPNAYIFEIGEPDYSKLQATPTNELERNIALSFDKYLTQTRTVYKIVDYRTTGVSNLQITANVSFAGRAAGESLNDLFTLKEFEPNLVINKDSEDIVVGWGETKYLPTSIGEWLAYEPMAQAYMNLFLNVVPETLPETIIFYADLTTESGNVLHCETPEVKLIP